MPKTGNGFPLSKSKNYRLGGGWHWIVISLTAGITKCRLLVAHHPLKQNYQAVLGVEEGADMRVIGCLEFHSTHPGWHVHGCCSSADKANTGRLRYPGMRRLPEGNKPHRRTTFDIGESDALRPAIEFFQLHDALNSMTPL